MKNEIRLSIAKENNMEDLGGCLGKLLESGDLVYLSGELGAGKTTLTRGIARGLDYHGRVNSPTFTLMNIYPARWMIYHFDFYRLQEADLYDLGLEDYLGQHGICIIEWPEVGKTLLPGDALWVDILLVDDDYDNVRNVVIYGQGPRSQAVLERLKEIVNSCD